MSMRIEIRRYREYTQIQKAPVPEPGYQRHPGSDMRDAPPAHWHSPLFMLVCAEHTNMHACCAPGAATCMRSIPLTTPCRSRTSHAIDLRSGICSLVLCNCCQLRIHPHHATTHVHVHMIHEHGNAPVYVPQKCSAALCHTPNALPCSC